MTTGPYAVEEVEDAGDVSVPVPIAIERCGKRDTGHRRLRANAGRCFRWPLPGM